MKKISWYNITWSEKYVFLKFKETSISITYGHILWNSLESFCDSSWCYKTNSISNKATCILQPTPPYNPENPINCMKNKIKPFCERDYNKAFDSTKNHLWCLQWMDNITTRACVLYSFLPYNTQVRLFLKSC